LSTILLPTPYTLAPTFNAFIDQQPEHITALLPGIHCYFQDVYAFCKQALDLSEIMLATDGGVASNMGTFGWIIGTTDGLPLAAGSGPVFRFDPHSYQAETYGCCSGMTFVQLAFQLCCLPCMGHSLFNWTIKASSRSNSPSANLHWQNTLLP
jgi:hypothetical protein